jgi:hypothetical protein
MRRAFNPWIAFSMRLALNPKHPFQGNKEAYSQTASQTAQTGKTFKKSFPKPAAACPCLFACQKLGAVLTDF